MFLKVLLLVLPLLVSGEVRPFRCNSSDEVRDMEIKQVFRVDNYTFVLRENQLIFFQAPFCFFNSKKQTVCAVSQAFEVDSEFKFKKSGNLKLKGFSYTRNTVAIYENLNDNKLEGYQINIADLIMDLIENDNYNLIKDQEYYFMFKGPSFTLLYKQKAEISFTISYNLNNPNRLNLHLDQNGKKYNSPKNLLDFKLSNLMAYKRYPSGNQTLLVFDPDSSKLHISFFEIGIDPKKPDEIKMQTRSIDFVEFFNCPRKLEKEDDLKGIFFFGGTFYIFIHRFYLAIKEDLLATRFTLTDEHYQAARELNFPNPDEVFFNVDLKKFVKVVGANAYFVILDTIFKLDASDGNLVATPEKELNYLKECEYSTSDHKGDLFCFSPELLFICSSDAKPISYASLFAGTGVKFDEGDRVQVAFEHSENLILMTKFRTYVFTKDSLDKKSSQISLKPSKEKRIIKDTHYLFQKSSRIGTGNVLLFWLLVILALAILSLIVYLRGDEIFAFMQKPNKKLSKPGPIKFEKRKNLSEKDEERSRNYRKLFRDFFSSISKSLTSRSPKNEKSERSERSENSPETGLTSEFSNVQPTAKLPSSPSSSMGEIMLHGSTKSFGFGKPIVIIPKHRLEAKRLKAALRRNRL